MTTRRHLAVFGLLLGVCAWSAGDALAQWLPAASDAENQAIAYSTTEPRDAVARLQRAIDTGTTELVFDPSTGYLRPVLQALQVPSESQVLVFSKTSLQRDLISPARPRAIYFNRDVYVGWVPGGRVLEIASIDPMLGPIFYTLSQTDTRRPRFERHTRACLQCHDSRTATGGVPGLLMKSVHTNAAGEPIPSAGTWLTTDRSPMKERWGGWYVTGYDGASVHMGTALGRQVDRSHYLASGSDAVRLDMLAHQTHVQNLLTRIGYRVRMALYFERQRNLDLRRSSEEISDETRRLIESLAEPLVQAMLFVGATSRRPMPYPLSYLIYSPSFDALPSPAKTYIYRRFNAVLSGSDSSDTFAHLLRADRAAMLDILRDTKPESDLYAH